MPVDLDALLARAGELSWSRHGRTLDCFLPGMFVADGRRGRYPAVSLTGPACALQCAHCGGRLLEPMPPAPTPRALVELGLSLWERGQAGMLLSGGSDAEGRLPWASMLPAIAELSARTGLYLTAHVGRLDEPTARGLKAAGVRQALVDLVGDAATAREVLHQPGLAWQDQTLAALRAAELEVVPHLILGLHGGQFRGEAKALELAADLAPRRLVFVVFMPLRHTALAGATPPPVAEVARFLAEARLALPACRQHLGCARPRGRYRQELDPLAVAAGVNALALASEAALAKARELGLDIRHHDTCCSLGELAASRERS